MNLIRPWIGFIFILTTVTLCAIHIQNQLLLNTDVSWLTHAAERLLAGGSYSTDFFETNPPLIIYLYTSLIFFKKIFSFNTFIALRIFIFLLSFFSLILSSKFLQQIFYAKNRDLFYILITLLAFIFLIFPINEIGQREHLLVILTTPYFLLLAARLENNLNISPNTIFMTALMAAIGFAIKPYFYFAFVFVEMYYSFSHKSLRSLFRLEPIVICSFAGLYLLSIFILNRDYLNFILPLIVNSYYKKYSTSLWIVLLKPQIIYFYIINAFLLLYVAKLSYKKFLQTLAFANLGFFVCYLVQHIGWEYHAIPLFSYTVLAATIIFYFISTQKEFSIYDGWICLGLTIALFVLCNNKLTNINLLITFFPVAYFGLLIFLFASLLWLADPNIIKTLYRLSIILLMNIIVFNYFRMTTLYNERTLFSFSLMVLSFLWLLPQHTFKDKIKALMIFIIGLELLLMPVYHFENEFSASVYYNHMYQKLVSSMQIYKQKSVYYFTSNSEVVYPTIDYAEQKYVSRFWSFSWLPLIKNPNRLTDYHAFYLSHQNELDFYINIILQDFAERKPQFVFVDQRNLGYYFNIQPDYIKLFSENKKFQEAWKNYHLISVLDNKPLFKFAIYQSNL